MRPILLCVFLLFSLPGSAADSWSIEYDRGMPARIDANNKGGFSFTLSGTRMISYALREPAGPLWKKMPPPSRQITLVVHVTETEGTVWDANPTDESIPEETPPRIGLVIHQAWPGFYRRFYSVERLDLRPGLQTLTVPVSPGAWKSVNGKIASQNGPTREAFRDCFLDRNTRIGVVFGGFFHGHGVSVSSGSATVQIVALRL